MTSHLPVRLRAAPLALLVIVAGLAAGCRRGPPVPQLSGALAAVVVAAAFEGGDAGVATGPLMLDAESFTRLGHAVRGEPFTAAELRAQVDRPFELVDRRAVLACPERRPCHVVDDGAYVEVWEAERRGASAELVVSRVQNVQGLYPLTRHITHRLTVAEVPGGWRLTRLERLPT